MTFAKSISSPKLSSPKQIPIPVHSAKVAKFALCSSDAGDVLKPPCDSLIQSQSARRKYLRRGSRAPSMFPWAGFGCFNEPCSPASTLLANLDQQQQQQHRTEDTAAVEQRAHQRTRSLVSMLISHLEAASLMEAGGEKPKFVLSPNSASHLQRSWSAPE